MKNNVIKLGQVRDLFTQWERVRAHFKNGSVAGFQISLIGPGGDETIYMGGVHRENSRIATRAALKMSAARMLEEDGPLELPDDFKTSKL